MYVVFDENKTFVSYSDEKFDGPYLFKEINHTKEDLFNWRWVGDYDTGQMAPVNEQPYEEPSTEEFFQKKYPLPLLLSLLLKQLYILADNQKLLDYNFEIMVKDFIKMNETPEDYMDFLRMLNKINK